MIGEGNQSTNQRKHSYVHRQHYSERSSAGGLARLPAWDTSAIEGKR